MRTGRIPLHIGCTKCDKKHYANGLCRNHYAKMWYRNKAILSYQRVG